jgi:hypothetical protein
LSTRIRIVIAVLLSLTTAFAVFCYFYPLFTVSGYCMIVDGKPVDIAFAKLLDSKADSNLFRQPLDEYATVLLSNMPALESVTCRIDLSGRVVCIGKRKSPIALLCLPEMYGVSSRCELLPLQTCGDVSQYPLLTGISVANVREFKRTTSTNLTEAVAMCKLLESEFPKLSKTISQIDFASKESPVIVMRSTGKRIVIGNGNIEEKLSYLNLIVDRLQKAPAREFDLRYGRSIIARDMG